MDREQVAKMLMENEFVSLTFRKADGEIVTRTATILRRPEDDAPMGKRESKNPDQFRFYQWGKENRFNPAAPGDWSSCLISRLLKAEPTTVEE